MSKHRFFIDNFDLISNKIEINDEDVIHQIVNVLRLKKGEKITVFDNKSNECELVLDELMKKSLIFSKESMKKKSIFNKVNLILYPALIKKDKLEYVLQKCTEIGVAEFKPIITRRTEKFGFNLERAKKIIRESAEQSHKSYLPPVSTPKRLEELVLDYETRDKTSHTSEIYYLDIDAPKLDLFSFRKKLNDETTKLKELHIFVGPEGGWDDYDYKQLERLTAKSISLGENVLRAETASIAICAMMLLPS